MNKMIFLSGPSCVGKGPLIQALAKFYPDLVSGWKKLVLYNSRSPRPSEIDGRDYYFRTTETIEIFSDDPSYLVLDVRGDLQAIDLNQLMADLEKHRVFFEGNPFLFKRLHEISFLDKIETLSVFLSPLSREEIDFVKSHKDSVDMQAFVAQVMSKKLLRRTVRQKTVLSKNDLEDIERRASSAWHEMSYAFMFDYVIVNHDGEDSENWDNFYYPLGDAWRTMQCVAKLLMGEECAFAGKWDANI